MNENRRIHCVPPEYLTDAELEKERDTIIGVFSAVSQAISKGRTPDYYKQFDKYVFGEGHLKFFYTKVSFLKHRYKHIEAVMRDRGMIDGIRLPKTAKKITPEWCRGWNPTEDDFYLDIVTHNLQDRFNGTN